MRERERESKQLLMPELVVIGTNAGFGSEAERREENERLVLGGCAYCVKKMKERM